VRTSPASICASRTILKILDKLVFIFLPYLIRLKVSAARG
jgi:hypothetical protein